MVDEGAGLAFIVYPEVIINFGSRSNQSRIFFHRYQTRYMTSSHRYKYILVGYTDVRIHIPGSLIFCVTIVGCGSSADRAHLVAAVLHHAAHFGSRFTIRSHGDRHYGDT